MKKLFFTLGLMIVSYGVFAQDASNAAVNKAMGAATHSRDFLMIQLAYDGWSGGGSDTISTGLNRGFNIALMYDIPIKKTNFSLAAGLGVSTSGIYLSDHVLDLTDASSNVPKFSKEDTYSRFKVATTYLEIPLELRYRQVADNANKGFKVGVGVKVGNLVNAHTKSKTTIGGSKHIEKEMNKRLFNTWRFAATARVGYGNFSLFGTYNLNPLFEDGTYDIRPYSIGICLSGL